MNKLTPAEEKGFNLIMEYIEDWDACNIDIYTEIVPCKDSSTGVQFCNKDMPDMYCFEPDYHPDSIAFGLMAQGFDSMMVNIYKPNSEGGCRVINFTYVYDESDGNEEWYEKKSYWFADFTLKLYATEEEYFQASTVDDLVISPEENQMFMKFVNDFTVLLNKHKGYKNGQSTP